MKVPAQLKVGIARCSPDDAEDLRAFQLATFGEGSRQVDAARAAWLFDGNPCRGADGRDIWICRRDGAIVGQQAEIPFDLHVGSQQRRASWGIDLMVDDVWRLKGVGPALVAVHLESRSLVGGLNMSDKGYALYARAGLTDLGIVPVYVRPLALSAAIDIASPSPRVRTLAAAGAPVWRAASSLAVGALRLAGARLEPMERFDERADAVWAAVHHDYPVLARRDHAVLSWLIDQRPDGEQMRRAYFLRRGTPVGYAVWRMGHRAEERAVVVDYLAPPRWVGPMLLAVGEQARREGAVALAVKSRNDRADRSLRAAGFLRRAQGAETPIRFMVHCADDDPDVAVLVRDGSSWLITSADCDLEPGMSPTVTTRTAGTH